MPVKIYTKKISIPFQDIDAAGIVFFTHLFRYAHETYEIFMASIGHPLYEYIQQGGLILPLKHAEADYKKPLKYGDNLDINLSVTALSNSSFIITYRCMDESGQLCAEIKTVHVVVNVETGKPVLIPDDLRTALSAYN